MQTVQRYDLPRRFAPLPARVTQCLVAATIVAVTTVVRLAIDRVIPGVAVYSLTFPAVAIATFLAGGFAGTLAVGGCQALVWYYIVPVRNSFDFGHGSDEAGLILATTTQLALVWLIAAVRRAERRSTALTEARGEELEAAVVRLREQADAQERLRANEIALASSRSNLEAIYQASGDGLALCEAFFDDDGHVVEYQAIEVNRAHAELTSATREQMLSKRISTIYPPIDPRWFTTAEAALKTGVMHDFDIRSRANGRWLNVRVSRVSDTLFQQTFVDVSERHQLEEQRQALLKEMSHRVMNNFQMVAGFLSIQAASAEPAARTQLKTAEARVHVLSRLHSLLAYTDSESAIDAAAYVKELCSYLAESLERPDAVTLICNAGAIRLATDQVVPIGFIVSELVTNAAKYAYPPPASGAVRVSLEPQPGGWVLTIADDGAGLGSPSKKTSGGLGTRLVQRFVRQMGATWTTTSDRGVRHEIVYPASGPEAKPARSIA